MRFVHKMKFDDNTFATAIVSMAVKGFLKIDENNSKEYTLTKIGLDTSKLSTGERAIARKLLIIANALVAKNQLWKTA